MLGDYEDWKKTFSNCAHTQHTRKTHSSCVAQAPKGQGSNSVVVDCSASRIVPLLNQPSISNARTSESRTEPVRQVQRSERRFDLCCRQLLREYSLGPSCGESEWCFDFRLRFVACIWLRDYANGSLLANQPLLNYRSRHRTACALHVHYLAFSHFYGSNIFSSCIALRVVLGYGPRAGRKPAGN